MIQMPDITEIENALFRADAVMGAAEAHGALCGMLCARGSIGLSEWIDHVLGQSAEGSPSLHDAVHLLSSLHRVTIEQMNDTAAHNQLLLPDDEDSLGERVTALANWCQGFVYGLGVGGIREEEMPEDSREMMRDILEIGRAATDTEEDDDEGREDDERAYMEIEEYVRMGAKYIFEELQPIQATQTIH